MNKIVLEPRHCRAKEGCIMHGPPQESWARTPRVRYLVCACLSSVCDVLMDPLGGFLLTAPTHNSHGQLVAACNR